MKMAVDPQSGPCMMALTTCSIQLSPCTIEKKLCWLFSLLGRTTEKLGSVPACASAMTWDESTMLFFCEVSRQSANVGQMAQPYGIPGAVVPDPGVAELAYSFQLSPAPSRRSMIVSTCGTGEYGRK